MVRHGEEEALGLTGVINTWERICHDIGWCSFVLDVVIEPEKFCQINLLFRGLNDLRHKVMEAAVVGEDSKLMAEQVLVPLVEACCIRGQKGLLKNAIGWRCC